MSPVGLPELSRVVGRGPAGDQGAAVEAMRGCTLEFPCSAIFVLFCNCGVSDPTITTFL
jgi:hypothetical protein